MKRFAGLIAALLATSASAHDWYQQRTDPITKGTCCGEYDCRAIPASEVQALEDGGFLYTPKGHYIPPDRVQPSPDERYHICNRATFFETPDEIERGIRRSRFKQQWTCFFAPRLTN